MRDARGRGPGQGRLLPLLLFVALVAITVLVVTGAAFGSAATATASTVTSIGAGSGSTQSVAAEAQTETFEVSASDLGDFGGVAPTISSPSAIVESMDTGKVLYEHNVDKRRAMASTTKIMTAILVLESGVDLSSEVKISSKAAGTWEPSMWVRTGDVLTVEDLLYALLLRSANGAAVALAENDAGSTAAFVEKMNAKAQKLGMKDTHFVTTNGLDATGHYSTAADLALLGRYAMNNAKFRELVDTKTHTLDVAGKSLLLTNTNKLLQQYDWVEGVKTGSTPNADHCLVSAGTKDGREVIAVVLGAPDSNTSFEDSKALLQYGLDQFRRVTIVEEGKVVAEAPVPGQKDATLQLVTSGAIDTELSRDETVTGKVSVERRMQLPVEAGDVYGHVVVTGPDGQQIGQVDLVATQSFAAQSQTLGGKIARFFRRVGAALGIGG